MNGVTAYNCVFVDNTNIQQTVARVPDIESSTLNYCLCTQTNTAWAGTGVGNVTNRPVFKGAVSNNFRYVFGSPGIDVGTNLAWTLLPGAVDLDGKARIMTTRVDMGPYEFIPPAKGSFILVR